MLLKVLLFRVLLLFLQLLVGAVAMQDDVLGDVAVCLLCAQPQGTFKHFWQLTGFEF